MTLSLPETLAVAAQAAVTADHLERDREAWNLPRARVETSSRGVHRDGLDWGGFRDLRYPNSRRHNLEAIAAYGAYRRSLSAREPASEAALPMSDATSRLADRDDATVS
jgi:hypothetical protein